MNLPEIISRGNFMTAVFLSNMNIMHDMNILAKVERHPT